MRGENLASWGTGDYGNATVRGERLCKIGNPNGVELS